MKGRQLGGAATAVTGAGAALLAAAGTACCAGPVLAPLVVAVLGAGGAAWAAGLKPYSGWLLAGSAAMIAFGFWSAHKQPKVCEISTPSTERGPSRIVRATLWMALLSWVVALLAQLTVTP